MYLPKHFENDDRDALHALIADHPLATWATTGDDGAVVVNHVPFLLDAGRGDHGTLVGHVARSNPAWRSLRAGVFVFHGPQAYVSPSWYPGKRSHGKVVPTWNYAVVHAHGTPRAVDDREALRSIVERLTRIHEAGQREPWAVDDAPADFVDQLLAAIVGIEVPIERLVGKWKVTQNRPPADREAVAAGLREQGDAGAAAMATLVEPTR